MPGRTWPVNDISETGASVLVPQGQYRCTVTINETTTQQAGKLMYVFAGRITEAHPEYAGVPLYENFVIGSDSDIDAQDPETWKKSIGARRLRQCLTAAGVEPSEDVDEMIEAANGAEILVLNHHEISVNPRTGDKEPRNKVANFYPVPTDNGPAPPTTRPAARQTVPTPATRSAPAPSAARGVAATARQSGSGISGATAARVPMEPCDICIADGKPPSEARFPRSEFVKHLREAHPDA